MICVLFFESHRPIDIFDCLFDCIWNCILCLSIVGIHILSLPLLGLSFLNEISTKCKMWVSWNRLLVIWKRHISYRTRQYQFFIGVIRVLGNGRWFQFHYFKNCKEGLESPERYAWIYVYEGGWNEDTGMLDVSSFWEKGNEKYYSEMLQ